MAGRHRLGDVGGLEHDLRVGNEPRRLGVPRCAEAEDRGRTAERLRKVRERRGSDPAADEEWPLDIEAEAVAERAEDCELITGLQCAERPCAGADRVDQELELARWREAEAHRARERPARRLEHEELARDSRLDAAACDPEQRVGPDLLAAGDPSSLGPH